jgi:diadenosine tetraphosphate (Ap4A) HIT family hydrolase
MNEDSNCPFCIENNLLRVPVIYEDDLWYFAEMHEGSIQNAGMAITKRHIKTPFDINEAEWSSLRQLLPKFKLLIDQNEKAQGYNIGWNVMPVGGQNVDHAHLHIIARYEDEPLAGKGIRYAFKADSNARSNRSAESS